MTLPLLMASRDNQGYQYYSGKGYHKLAYATIGWHIRTALLMEIMVLGATSGLLMLLAMLPDATSAIGSPGDHGPLPAR